jgi:hypothetical protein
VKLTALFGDTGVGALAFSTTGAALWMVALPLMLSAETTGENLAIRPSAGRIVQASSSPLSTAAIGFSNFYLLYWYILN